MNRNPLKDADRATVLCSAGCRRDVPSVGAELPGEPAAVAVDLGSANAQIWAVGHGAHATPTAGDTLSQPETPVRRGRIVDDADCVSLLTQLLRIQLLRTHLAPVRVVRIRTVRAAALGCAATTPPLTTRLASDLRVPVRTPATPRSAAPSDTGLAAMAACRHRATA
jgi:hypothetical protein